MCKLCVVAMVMYLHLYTVWGSYIRASFLESTVRMCALGYYLTLTALIML